MCGVLVLYSNYKKKKHNFIIIALNAFVAKRMDDMAESMIMSVMKNAPAICRKFVAVNRKAQF